VTDAGALFSNDTVQVERIDTSSGYQIIYYSGWGCNDLCRDGDVYWNSSPWNSNLYSDPNTPLQVSIRLDTSSVWIFSGEGSIKNKFDLYDITTNTWSIGVLNQNIQGAAIFQLIIQFI